MAEPEEIYIHLSADATGNSVEEPPDAIDD